METDTSKLPTEADIQQALQQLAQRYINSPEYVIDRDSLSVVHFDDGTMEIQCRGQHHVANAYDLGCLLGDELQVNYGNLALGTGSYVRFTPLNWSLV